MSQVLIFSDLHLHKHKKSLERLQHCLDALEWVFKTAQKHSIKNIIFCGDLFHDREKIDIYTYHRAFEIFRKYMEGPNKPGIYLLLGNHDLWHLNKWDISSVAPLSAISGVTVIDRPISYVIDGFELSFLPYTHNPIEDLKKISNGAHHKVLFGHLAVDGALWNAKYGTVSEVSVEHDGDMVKITPEVFKEWNQVFLGHYHAAQILDDGTNQVEYVGSPLELSFGEAFQKKHIIIYDLITHEKKYIENTFSPKHIICGEAELPKYDLGNAFVRVSVDDIASSRVVELKNELKNAGCASIQFEAKPKKIEEDTKIIEDAKSILQNADEMLKRYLQETDLKGLNSDRLLNIGQEICTYAGESE